MLGKDKFREIHEYESELKAKDQTIEMLCEALRAVVLNWRNLNDEHFSGPSEKLKRICEETLAKVQKS